MKRQLFAIGVFAMASCFGLNAQGQDLRADIPFPFAVGNATLPPGEYIVNINSGLLNIRDLRGLHHVMSLSNPSYPDRATQAKIGKGMLLFTRMGNEYFLSSVWSPHMEAGRVLQEGRRQRELARSINTPVDRTNLALASK